VRDVGVFSHRLDFQVNGFAVRDADRGEETFAILGEAFDGRALTAMAFRRFVQSITRSPVAPRNESRV
jgi:hypothetical protein